MIDDIRKFALAAVLIATAGTAAASPSQWAGVAKSQDGKRVRVSAAIEGEKVSLRFGEPANCAMTAGLLDVEKDTTIYRFKVPQNGGGFCGRLYPGDLAVTPAASRAIKLTFRSQKIPWSGVLDRVVDP
jgi:hypothetical protein